MLKLAIALTLLCGAPALAESASPQPLTPRLKAASEDVAAAREADAGSKDNAVSIGTDKSSNEIYNFKANSLDGHEIALSEYKGKVMLIVNTASHCGYTPQYAGLEALSKKYSAQGLAVLGFPCNQFGNQESGSASEISSFCTKNYGVTFQMFDKIDVNGKNANPLYVFLKKSTKDQGNIRWNFTKFLVGRHGNVIKRYGSMASPESISDDIESALKSQ